MLQSSALALRRVALRPSSAVRSLVTPIKPRNGLNKTRTFARAHGAPLRHFYATETAIKTERQHIEPEEEHKYEDDLVCELSL